VSGPTIDTSGTLFGTTVFGGGNDIDDDGAGGGIVYQLSGQGYAVLHSFCSAANCTDGEYPEAGVMVDAEGVIYGTTAYGGDVGQIAGPGGVMFKIAR
jgi:hypothetical protein